MDPVFYSPFKILLSDSEITHARNRAPRCFLQGMSFPSIFLGARLTREWGDAAPCTHTSRMPGLFAELLYSGHCILSPTITLLHEKMMAISQLQMLHFLKYSWSLSEKTSITQCREHPRRGSKNGDPLQDQSTSQQHCLLSDLKDCAETASSQEALKENQSSTNYLH